MHDFLHHRRWLVDGTPVTPTEAGATSIVFTMPDHAPGQVMVSITVGVNSAILKPFTYTGPAGHLALAPAEGSIFPVTSGSPSTRL